MNRRFVGFLLWVAVFGAYTRTSFYFPYDIYVVPGLLGLLLTRTKREMISVSIFIVAFVVIHFVGTVLIYRNDNYIYEQASSLGLFGLSIFSSLGFYGLLRRLNEVKFARLMLLGFSAVVLFALLERVGITSGASDYIRSLLYPAEVIYLNDARDVSNYGFVRPKVFSSEPSYVAQFFSSFAVAFFVLYRGKNSIGRATALFSVLLVILPSVSILAGYLLVLVDKVLLSKNTVRRSDFKTFSFYVLGLSIALIGLWSIAVRVGYLGGDLEVSAYIRLVEPARLALNSLLTRPLFGFGIGANGSLSQLVLLVRTASDTPYHILKLYSDQLVSGSFLFSILWQFGLIGTGVYIALVFRLFKLLSNSSALCICYFGLLSVSLGDFHTPVSWFLIIPVAVALKIRSERRVMARSERVVRSKRMSR